MDAPARFQLGLQDPATPVAEGIMSFHNHLIAFMIGIAFFVFFLIVRCLMLYHEYKHKVASKLLHNSVLEITWTIIPVILLGSIAIPSFSLLYSIEELVSPDITIKVLGHQWYWSYELADFNEFNTIKFDSYMLPENDLILGGFRNLEVDNRLVVPIKAQIRFLITSTDVLHSWAVPSLGVKADATPGRLLQIPAFIKRNGIFYGQCSEICGVNHAFMPIVVVGLDHINFFTYIVSSVELTGLKNVWLIFQNK